MARFIKLPQKDGNNIVLLNTDYVVMAKYHDNRDDPSNSVIIEVARNSHTDLLIVDFKSKADATEFLQKNFLIFNS